MNSWFTVKVKYTKQLEDGQLKRVTEPYLLDAVSFTDAEARIYEEMGQIIRGEFIVTNIAKTEFADIFQYEDEFTWYKCKVSYLSVDADSGKEKRVTNQFLVSASNVKEAYERLQESLSDMMVSFDVPMIQVSPIVDIFPYDGEREVVVDHVDDQEDEAENPSGVFTAPSDDEDEEESEVEVEDEFEDK
jgi:hypothetical protein